MRFLLQFVIYLFLVRCAIKFIGCTTCGRRTGDSDAERGDLGSGIEDLELRHRD